MLQDRGGEIEERDSSEDEEEESDSNEVNDYLFLVTFGIRGYGSGS
jgi:hypothetical protein